jgi:uncharacterized RDD family membrane protein YckC
MTKNTTILRLFAAAIYELLLLIALWMLIAYLFIYTFGDATTSYKRTILQLVLWLSTGAYFVWCWRKSGQTLATQTWKIKLVNEQNQLLSMQQCVFRYALASAFLLPAGLGFIWIFIDKDKRFLHDRLLKTRFISLV